MPVRARLLVVWNLVAKSLSGRLLLLTLLFVLAGQVLIFVPAIGVYHRELLADHILSAELAILPFTTADGRNLPASLREDVLAHADADAVVLTRHHRHDFYQSGAMPTHIDRTIDLTGDTLVSDMINGMDCLLGPGTRTLYVRAPTQIKDAQSIGIVLPEASIRAGLFVYAGRVMAAGLFLSGLAAALVFVSLFFFLVRPMQRITQAMVSFSENPEDAARVLQPTNRADEIGVAERELAAMQRELSDHLKQKERLAALGAAVARIQHDLRNILATAQLASDRLAASDDPQVRRLTPALVAALDRAVALATSTLAYGKAQAPVAKRFALRGLIAEAGEAALGAQQDIVLDNRVEAGFAVLADRDQIFRVAMNLLRNAAEAMDGKGEIAVTAAREEKAVAIIIADSGPGIPEAVRHTLFDPFVTASRAGGFGLGLAIARELARGHGGELTLVSAGPRGTVFRLVLPEEN